MYKYVVVETYPKKNYPNGEQLVIYPICDLLDEAWLFALESQNARDYALAIDNFKELLPHTEHMGIFEDDKAEYPIYTTTKNKVAGNDVAKNGIFIVIDDKLYHLNTLLDYSYKLDFFAEFPHDEAKKRELEVNLWFKKYYDSMAIDNITQDDSGIYHPKCLDELKALVNKLDKNGDYAVSLKDIDTSNITDMSGLFYNSKRIKREFEGIESWNVSNVTNMQKMFYCAKYFDNALTHWKTKSLKNMNFMFAKTNFNQNINHFIIDSVININGIFDDNKSFNQPLDNWNTTRIWCG